MKSKRPKSFKRRKQSKTNYKRRLGLLKSRKPRLIVRKSLNNIRVQIAEYLTDGDKIVASAISSDLKKEGWKYNCANLPAAYLTGMLCGSRAIKAGIKEAVLDIGLNEPINGCKIYAALKGAIDAGLQIPHSSDAFPKEERLNGAHLQNQKADEVAKAIEQIKSKLAGSKKE